MKKLLLLFIAIYLFGFNSDKISTTILTTSKYHAIIDTKVPAGMTGYVMHNDMMIAKAVSLGKGNVKYLPLVKLKNEALATPKIMPKKDDTIIFGLYNNRGLILAPNQDTYIKTVSKYPNINFINSDIFANYFTTKPDIDDFHKFCRDFNVGFVDFILDKEYIVDCESFVVLEKKPIQKVIPYKHPFFTNYEKFTNSLFSIVPSNWIEYYKSFFKIVK